MKKKIIYKKRFKEEEDDETILFTAYSLGNKEHLKVYQTEWDKSQKNFVIETRHSTGTGKDIRLIRQITLNEMISSLIDEPPYKKIEIDEINMSKTWFWLLGELKKYKKLSKYGSDGRKFYYSILWSLKDNLKKNNKVILNLQVFLERLFDMIDSTIQEKGWLI